MTAPDSDQAQLSLDLVQPRRVQRAPAGVIVGGPCNGWAYVLLEMRMERGRTYPYVRASGPAWPFPKEVLVKPPARLA